MVLIISVHCLHQLRVLPQIGGPKALYFFMLSLQRDDGDKDGYNNIRQRPGCTCVPT